MIQQGATVGTRWEKVASRWRWVKPYLLGFLVVVVVAGAILALLYVPKMQVPVCPPGQDGLPPKICFDIENEARKTLAYILGGLLAIIGIYMAHRRIRAMERQVQIGQEQLQVAQEGQITERFTRAIEQLGSSEMAIRLGGIYALERIANDSDKDYWTIMETLTAYVRERAPWKGKSQNENVEKLTEEQKVAEVLSPWQEPKIKPATDIQAVLTVLARRKYWRGHNEVNSLDLSNTDLQGANLHRAHLEGAFFDGAHLENAILVKSCLNEALLREVHLEGAHLDEAHLKSAILDDANIKRGDLRETHLEGARLWAAHLEGAFLKGAYLEGADLRGAHLEGAYLGEAIGLIWEQLAKAIIDDKTILPSYLQEQPLKAKGQGGDNEE